jgi:hypothetical protein
MSTMIRLKVLACYSHKFHPSLVGIGMQICRNLDLYKQHSVLLESFPLSFFSLHRSFLNKWFHRSWG